MGFEFGKRRRSRSRRSRRSRKVSRRTRRSRMSEEVKVSRKRSRRGKRSSRRGSRRASRRRGGSSGAKKLFTQRVKAVQVLMKKGMGRKAAWKKVMSGRAFGVQIIPGF